jgi:branched-chain amino acid transport system permease protein
MGAWSAPVARETHNVMVTRGDGNSAGRTKVTAQNATARPFGFFHVLLFAAATAIVLLLMPFVLAAYPLIILSQILVFSIACLGLNLLFGTAGSFSLGHATYFGVAAYTGAFLYRFYAVESLEAYLASGLITSTSFATVIGFLCARTTKIFFVLLTLSFSMVAHSLVIDGAVFMLFGGLGWALYLLGEGSMYIPRFTILGIEFNPHEFNAALYNVIVVAFIVTILLLWRISRSPFGQALRAIRDNEVRAAFIGIPVWQYRWYAFILSGFFVGLAGGLYGQLARQITPEQLHWIFSAQLVLAIVLGGMRHFVGPILGAFAFVGLDEFASRWPIGRGLAFGILLIIVVFVFPRGVAGAVVALTTMVRRWRHT